jgi:subtilase family serine protease
MVEVTAPDLVEPTLTDPPSLVVWSGSFPVTDTVENVGNGPSGGSTTRYYLSLDTLRNGGDIYFSATRTVLRLAPGAISSGTVTLSVTSSTPLGTYYLLACADDERAVIESNETNNCVASATTVEVTVSNLVESALSDPPSAAVLGGSFTITDTVYNVGNGPSGSSTTRYYLSPDTLKSSTDIRFSAVRSVPGLAPGATSTGTITVKVASTTPGVYYLLACADDTGTVVESNEANNCVASATTVQVTP